MGSIPTASIFLLTRVPSRPTTPGRGVDMIFLLAVDRLWCCATLRKDHQGAPAFQGFASRLGVPRRDQWKMDAGELNPQKKPLGIARGLVLARLGRLSSEQHHVATMAHLLHHFHWTRQSDRKLYQMSRSRFCDQPMAIWNRYTLACTKTKNGLSFNGATS